MKFPTSLALEHWIAQEYISDFQSNSLRDKWVKNKPFEHTVLPEFFLPEIAEMIRLTTEEAVYNPNTNDLGVAKDSDLDWAAYSCIEVVNFIYGTPFRLFLKALSSENLVKVPGFVPQISKFKPKSIGYAIHNDCEDERDIVTILNLNKNRLKSDGGEFCLWEISKSLIEIHSRIPPDFNSFLYFRISEQSWHSVAPITGQSNRVNVLFDWLVS